MEIIPQQEEISLLTYQVESLANNIVLGYYYHRNIIKLMIATGARVSDALTCEHWEIDNVDGIYFYAQKNSTFVHLPLDELPNNITTILNEAREASNRISYEDIARYIKNYQKYRISTAAKNDLRTHICRYYFAKRKYSEGKSIAAISAMLGDTQQRTLGYIGATITIK